VEAVVDEEDKVGRGFMHGVGWGKGSGRDAVGRQLEEESADTQLTAQSIQFAVELGAVIYVHGRVFYELVGEGSDGPGGRHVHNSLRQEVAGVVHSDWREAARCAVAHSLSQAVTDDGVGDGHSQDAKEAVQGRTVADGIME
jgi:hypothetical protein